MQQLNFDDLSFVVRRIPAKARQLMKEHGVILGGGYIRDVVLGVPPSDLDFFGATDETLTLCAGTLEEAWHARIYKTQNAFTILAPPRHPVQFIRRWLYAGADAPRKVLESFDFTMAAAVVWWEADAERKAGGRWRSLVHDDWYADLAARRLRYTSPVRDEDAGGSTLRVVKFLGRGWRIAPESLAAVLARVMTNEVCLGALDLPLDQLRALGFGGDAGNNESVAAWSITALLRQADPLTTIAGVELVAEPHEDDPLNAELEGA